MSDTKILKAFNPREEKNIPAWTSPEPPPVGPLRVYVIGMRAVDNRIEYYFVDRPDTPDPRNDGPLAIRVPFDCVIVLKLDDAWAWEFRCDDAVVLGPMQYPDKQRYFNLTPTVVDGACREVRFIAKYLDLGAANTDPYAIYLYAVQSPAKSGAATQLMIRIDPDMINPGDHDPPPPPPG